MKKNYLLLVSFWLCAVVGINRSLANPSKAIEIAFNATKLSVYGGVNGSNGIINATDFVFVAQTINQTPCTTSKDSIALLLTYPTGITKAIAMPKGGVCTTQLGVNCYQTSLKLDVAGIFKARYVYISCSKIAYSESFGIQVNNPKPIVSGGVNVQEGFANSTDFVFNAQSDNKNICVTPKDSIALLLTYPNEITKAIALQKNATCVAQSGINCYQATLKLDAGIFRARYMYLACGQVVYSNWFTIRVNKIKPVVTGGVNVQEGLTSSTDFIFNAQTNNKSICPTPKDSIALLLNYPIGITKIIALQTNTTCLTQVGVSCYQTTLKLDTEGRYVAQYVYLVCGEIVYSEKFPIQVRKPKPPTVVGGVNTQNGMINATNFVFNAQAMNQVCTTPKDSIALLLTYPKGFSKRIAIAKAGNCIIQAGVSCYQTTLKLDSVGIFRAQYVYLACGQTYYSNAFSIQVNSPKPTVIGGVNISEGTISNTDFVFNAQTDNKNICATPKDSIALLLTYPNGVVKLLALQKNAICTTQAGVGCYQTTMKLDAFGIFKARYVYIVCNQVVYSDIFSIQIAKPKPSVLGSVNTPTGIINTTDFVFNVQTDNKNLCNSSEIVALSLMYPNGTSKTITMLQTGVCSAQAGVKCYQATMKLDAVGTFKARYVYLVCGETLYSAVFAIQVAPLPQRIGIENALKIVEEPNNNVTFAVYPNPATRSNVVTLDLKELVQEGSSAIVTIHDGQGRLVQELSVANKTEVNVDVSNFREGNYFIKIQSNSTVSTKKLIVEY